MKFSYFNKQKVLIWFVIILSILNISFTIGLFLNMPDKKKSHKPMQKIRKRQPEKIRLFINKELNLSKDQSKVFKRLQEKHFRENEILLNLKKEYKDQSFNELIKDEPREEIIDSLNRLIMRTQYQLEKNTSKHFIKLKSILKPEQYPHFKKFIKRLSRFHERNDRRPRRIKKR